MEEIITDPANLAGQEGAAALALVELDGQEKYISLKTEDLAEVEEGTELRILFTYNPLTKGITVEITLDSGTIRRLPSGWNPGRKE